MMVEELRTPFPARLAPAELEMPLVDDGGHGFGAPIAADPRKLPGRKPRGVIPDAGSESGVKLGKFPL